FKTEFMKYFSKDYLAFFKELAANNHKEWFDLNRKRYETVVREPFKIFISDLINEVSKLDEEVQIEAKDAIFRINRDIRFSKDKTPYKINNSAIISKMGRKDKSYPGLYIELSPEHLAIFGGIYMADTQQIQKIRLHILKYPDQFRKIITNKDFVNKYGEIRGTKNKRIPKEFRLAAEEQALIMNKQWYYQAFLSPKIITGNDLMEKILEYHIQALPFQKFLINALQN
ncbi:MAG: hypothetical protein DSY82_02565, partial [Flavobacteriia bacterium]